MSKLILLLRGTNSILQTGILFVLCLVGSLSEMLKTEVCDLDNPATVQQTVGAFEATVKLQVTFVNIFHSLTNTQRQTGW